MVFRNATLCDLPRLLELEQCVVEAERPFNNEIKAGSAIYYDIEDLIVNENSLMLVVDVDGEIVATGYAQIRVSKGSLSHNYHGYLGFMYVTPAHRGKGLNAQLIDKLVQWCREKNVLDLYLDVYAENESAIRAYEKVGFTSSMVEMKLTLNG